MHLRTIGEQGTLDGRRVLIRRNVFTLPLDELRAQVEAAQVECHECETMGRVGKRMLAVDVYDDPWQEEPTTIHVCARPSGVYHGGAGATIGDYGSCVDLLTDTSWADFRYFWCDSCGRLVASQCHSNGWHSYVRVINECEEQCLRCYEADIYENGLPRNRFEEGTIPGMFFNRGDLETHGFALVPDCDGAFINNGQSARAFCDKALDLIDDGHAVAVDYGAQGIGGSEGYASLYARKLAA